MGKFYHMTDIKAWALDFLIGGFGAITKTATAPIERIKLLIQTQDANPLIRSGEVARYTGIGNCFTRVTAEQGFASFWRGNGANVIRMFLFFLSSAAFLSLSIFNLVIVKLLAGIPTFTVAPLAFSRVILSTCTTNFLRKHAPM